MAQMNISNTLWNDTSSGEIAYSEQVKDKLIDWDSLSYDKVPTAFKTDANKFQTKLNDFFLKHYNEFQHFLQDKGVEGVIDTWKDVEDFLESISDSEAMTLLTFINNIELASGTLNIRMSEDYPGAVEAVETSSDINIRDSHINPETGAIRVVFNFD